MRKDSGDEVAAAARRRLEVLRQELVRAGLRPGEPLAPAAAEDSGTDDPATRAPGEVRPAGRHLRERRGHLVAGWIEDRLPAGLRGRVRLGSPELAVLAVLLAAGLVVAAVVVLRSGSASEAVPVAHRAVARSPASAPARPPASAGVGAPLVTPGSAASPASPKEQVVVDVAGKVRHPGVVRLPAGARVVDAIRKAGGARRRVDLSSLNLAQVLTDGQQVLVGVPAAPGIAASAAASPGAAAPGTGVMVHLNSATQEQLESLPGVGPVTAQRILAWRSAHGSFSSVDELLEIDGIGEKTLADIAPHATL